MRDTIQNETYFREFIEEESARIEMFETKLLHNEVHPDRVLLVKKKVHSLKLGILIADYSRGCNIDQMSSNYTELLQEIPDVWEADFYSKNLWMISLGILLNQKKWVYEIMTPLIRQAEIEDWLFDFLLGGQKDREIQSKLLFPHPYEKLQNIAEAEETERGRLLEEYINGMWYDGHKDCGWHNSHKSKEKLYYGYWSFEGAAIAKLLHVEDGELKSAKYYPYDLAHYE